MREHVGGDILREEIDCYRCGYCGGNSSCSINLKKTSHQTLIPESNFPYKMKFSLASASKLTATGLVIHELRVTSYNTRVTIHELRITIHELQSTSYNPRVTIHELQSTSYEQWRFSNFGALGHFLYAGPCV